jgi:hypothetical protein
MNDEQKNKPETENTGEVASQNEADSPKTEEGDSRLKFSLSEATGFIFDHDLLDHGRLG